VIRTGASSLLRFVVFALGVYLTYLAVINALIVSGAMRFVVNRLAPVHAHFDWSSAYSPWFLRVHTKDLIFRGEDSSVQWEMRFDRANATFALTDFFSKRVHMRDAQASGVQIRIRFKVDAARATPAVLAKLPPMPHELAAPIKPAVPPPEPTDDNYYLWTVQLDDVVGDQIHEVWIDSLHYTDVAGDIRGGFYLKPLRVARVSSMEYHATGGTITSGTDALIHDIGGKVALTLRDFDLRAPSSWSSLDRVDAKANVEAKIVDLHAFADELHNGGGPLQVSVEMVHGAIQPGSRAQFRSQDWTATSSAQSASGTSRIDVRVDGESVAHAVVETWGASVSHGKETLVKIPAMNIALRSPDTNLTKPPERWNASVDLPSGEAPHLAALNSIFGNKVFEDGSLRVVAHADFDQHNVRNAHIQLKDVNIGKLQGWWVNVSASPMTYSLKGASMHATVIGKMRDAQVPLELLGAPGVARSFIGSQSFALKSIVAIVGGATWTFNDVRLIGDSVEAYAHVRKDARGATGAMIFETKLANVGLDLEHGDATIHPLASHVWYERTLAVR
jgi:hypothetical protein